MLNNLIKNMVKDLREGNVICVKGLNAENVADIIVTEIGGDFGCDVHIVYIKDDFEEQYLNYIGTGNPTILILKNVDIKDYLKCHYRIILDSRGYIAGYIRPIR